MSPWILVGSAVFGMCLVFTVVFAVAQRIDNYGIVDIAWSYAFGVLALFYAILGAGWAPRRWLLATLVLAWSFRLGTHLYRRVMGHHPVEDGRYIELRRKWGSHLIREMFRFFQLQALSVVVLGIPFFLSVQNVSPQFSAWEIAGAVLWLIGISGESVADWQLAAFKRTSTDRSLVCDAGLWRFSRHPNYFFEWLVWVGYFLFACASPWGWTTAYAPLAMLYLLFRVTGIPLTEEQAIRTKGDAYRRYRATTSAFVPWPPKTTASTPEPTR
jgi:steroid 5-alpha reductase family enzyme